MLEMFEKNAIFHRPLRTVVCKIEKPFDIVPLQLHRPKQNIHSSFC